MRTLTKKIDLFKFHELSEVGKQKVIADNSDILINCWNANAWAEEIIVTYEAKLEAMGFEDAEIFFSGFYNQGDGACFDAKPNLEKLAKTLLYKSKLVKRIATLADNGEIEGKIYKNAIAASRYKHEHTRYFEFCEDEPKDIIEKMRVDAEFLRVQMCKLIYKALYEEYQYLTSVDAITEYFVENDDEFTAEGKSYDD